MHAAVCVRNDGLGRLRVEAAFTSATLHLFNKVVLSRLTCV